MSTIQAVRNPQDGAMISVRAGDAISVVFAIENDNPMEVVGFYFSLTNLPDNWWQGPSMDEAAYVVAGGHDALTLTLQPPASAQSANYPFQVQVIAVNDLAITPPACSLILQVEEGAAQPVAAETTVAPVDTAPPAPPSVPEAVQPVAPSPTVVASSPTPPPPAVVAPAPPMVAVSPQPVSPTVEVESPAPPARTHEASETAGKSAVSTPVQEVRSAPPPPSPPPPPARPPEPVPETVSLKRDPVAMEVQLPGQLPPPDADRQVINPEDRRILRILPGEKMLLRFKFHNTQNLPCNYILDEDRMAALPDGWLERTQAQVNITPNAEGEVFCLISPPVNARPGEYQFALFIGAQHTANPEERYYTLLVEATPAVKLTAATMKKAIGPFATEATFPLVIANAGNSDTAFRVSVREPRAAEDNEEDAVIRDLYETADWSYHFNEEIENLKSPSQGKEPKPVELKLMLKRRNAWWWGVKESHDVTVAAVPVTDITNGGKDENLVQLHVERWRLLPFPYALLLPIILVFMLLGSQSWDLRVTNGLQVPEKQEYFVFGSLPLSAHIAWKAFPLAPQRLKYDEGSVMSLMHRHRLDAGIRETDLSKYGRDIKCSIQNEGILVRFLPARDSMIEVLGDNGPLDPEFTSETIGSDQVEVSVATYRMPVTTHENRYSQLIFRNADRVDGQIRILVFQQPDSMVFKIPFIADRVPKSGEKTLPVKINASYSGAAGELVFVTNAREQQIIRILLEGQ